MANNLFANVPAACVAKQTISFAAAGFNSSNCYIIYEVGSPLKSWDPSRTINAITGFTQDKGYYIVPKITMDMEAVVAPPLPTGGGGSTPAAPTGGVVNDSADTFGFTLNPLFTLGEHEFSLDWGGTWNTVTANPIAVGNIAAAAGQVRVRVKAIGGNPASTALANGSAFTVSGAFDLLADIPWDIKYVSGVDGFTDSAGGTPVSDGSLIGLWKDQNHLGTLPHPNYFDLQQATVNRATYRATGFNGKPCVETGRSGTDSLYLQTDVFGSPVSKPITVYVEAVKTGALVGTHAFLMFLNTGMTLAINGGTGKLAILDTAAFRDTTYTVVDNTRFIAIVVIKADNTADVWVNGTQVGTNLALTGTTTLSRVFISDASANVWPGKVRHPLIRFADLTSQVSAMNAWGMTDAGI